MSTRLRSAIGAPAAPPSALTEAFCDKRCPEGRPCACNKLDHELHICSEPRCRCHSLDRYNTALSKIRLRQNALAQKGMTAHA